MNDDKLNEARLEILSVMNKYGMKNGSFSANGPEKEMIGMHNINNEGSVFSDFAESVYNAARLYQSGREKMMKLFEKF